MNKYLFLSILLLSAFIYSCKKSEESPTGPEDNALNLTENSYPSTSGTNYKYNYVRIDSSGQASGTRILYYKGTANVQGTNYTMQIDSVILGTSIFIDTAYFRTTGSGVYYYIDTTGFAASITDSALISLIPYVQLDQELLTCTFKLVSGKTWTAFKINITQPLTATVVNVSAIVTGTETVTLNLPAGSSNKEALKIKFTLTLDLDPLSPTTFQTFTANAWLVPNIGNIKTEGNGALVNFLTGFGIDFADTSTTVSQILTEYDIK